MKAVIVCACYFAISLVCGENSPTSDAIYENEIALTENNELHNNSRLIEELVQNLRQAAQQAYEALQKFSDGVKTQISLYADKVLQDIGQLRERLTQAANDVLSRFQNAGSSLNNCIEIHRNDSDHLFSDTISKTMSCADARIIELKSEMANLSNITSSALVFADNVLQRLGTCTSENRNDMIAAGSCLGGVVTETQLKVASFAIESGLSTARLNIGVATLPLTLQGCAGARLAEAALGTARIAIDIGSCSATSAFSALTNIVTGSAFKKPIYLGY